MLLGGFLVMNTLYSLSLPQLPIKLFPPSISLLSPSLTKEKTVNKALSALSPHLRMAHSCHCHEPKGEYGMNKTQLQAHT